jgi:hypothetical protein
MASGQSGNNDTKRFLTTRRSVLKLAGAAGLAAVTAGTAAAAPSGDFDRTVNLGNKGLSSGDTIDSYLSEHFTSGTKVEIPAGEYNWNGGGLAGSYSDAALVGQGDVILNRPRPEVQVRPNVTATGGTVTIQNITVHGKAGYDQSRIRVAADSGANLVFNNFNLPHGTVDDSDSIGIYAGQDHAGHLLIENSYFSKWGNLALYLKAPGNRNGGAGGPIEVANCVFVNNNAAAVKFGSSDSHVHDSLIVNDEVAPAYYNGAVSQRGLKIDVPGDNLLIENMDFYHTEVGAMPIILDVSDGQGGSGTIRNCRIHNDASTPAIVEEWDTQGYWEGENIHLTGSGDLSVPSHFQDICTGDGCEVPNLDPEADRSSGDGTSGNGDSGSGSSDDGTSDSDGSSLPDGTPVEVVAAEDAEKFQYEFTTDGDAAKVTSAGNLASEGNDSITKTESETVVSGATGSGFGDSFRISGDVTSFTANTALENITVNVGGTDVTADLVDTTVDDGNDNQSGDSQDQRPVEIVSADNGPKFQYEFTTDGDAEKVISAGNLSAEANDSIETSNGQTVVTGEVGNGFGDTFRVTGDVSNFSATTDAENFTVSIDGTDVTADLVGDSQSSDGSDDGQSSDGSTDDGQSDSGSDDQTEQRPNLLIIDGTRSPDVANYAFEVSGTVKRSSEHSTVQNGGAKWDTIVDEVSDSSAVGVVGEAKDAYRFSGKLEDIEIQGDARAVIKEA